MRQTTDNLGTFLVETAALLSVAVAASLWLVRPIRPPELPPLPVTQGPIGATAAVAAEPVWNAETGTLALPVANDQLLSDSLPSSGLKTLLIDGGRLSTHAIQWLARYPELEHLRLRGIPIGDEEVRVLTRLRQLRILNVPHAVFSDKGLQALSELPRLEMLRFGSPHVTDCGLEALSRSRCLRFLHIIDCPVSTKGVVSLTRCTHLESLYIDGVELDDEAVDILFAHLPGLHLHLNQQHHDRDPNRAVHSSHEFLLP